MTDKQKWIEVTVMHEAARCLLCHDAPCTAACPSGRIPDKMVRSIRFENTGAAARFMDMDSCSGCSAPCEDSCIAISGPLKLRELANWSAAKAEPAPKGVSLAMDFCGIRLENPFLLSSSVVASNYDMCARALEMGWAGVAFKTVGTFVPQEVSPRFDNLGKEGVPFLGFRNLEQISDHTLEENLNWMRRLKADFPNKVLIASVMGRDEEEWILLAKSCTEAGADMIECNFSCPQMVGHGLGSDVGQDPVLVAMYTAAVRRATDLPVLAKMTPNLGNMEPPARAAVAAGATGIAAINTVKSITGVDLEETAATPSIAGLSAVSGYSGKAVKPIALRFLCELAQDPALAGVPLSGMGGIENWRDAAEFLMLGCTSLQVTTAIMQYGYRIIEDLTDGLARFMVRHGMHEVSEMVGLALPHMVEADRLDRSSVCYPRFERGDCVGCGRCFIACRDAGHQAIHWDGKKRVPTLDARACVGCQLCLQVCPARAISTSARVEKKTQLRQNAS